MFKTLPILAIVVAFAALVTAINRNGKTPPPPSDQASPQYEALEQRFQILEEKYHALEASHRRLQGFHAQSNQTNPDRETAPSANLATKVDTLADKQTELEEVVKNIDEFGIIESMENEVVEAYNTLLDTNLPVWPRAKQAERLKRLNLFDDRAVASMMDLWNQSVDPNEKAAALHALSGAVTTPEFRDQILAALNEDMQNNYPSPKLRYTAIEALQPMLPDPAVEEWLQYMAENDPELELRARAGKPLGIPPPAKVGFGEK